MGGLRNHLIWKNAFVFLAAMAWPMAGNAAGPPEPTREFRGAWIATVYNLDWPQQQGASAEQQQAQLRQQLDLARDIGLNAIFFQVRPESDAMWRSRTEPWSRWLSGRSGADPGYDPLAFAIAEAHARGLQLHAWINPYRAKTSADVTMAPQHVTNRHPEWTRTYRGQVTLDPGLPEVRAYIVGIISELLKNYDLDGIHFDDYFYPYPTKRADGSRVEEFPDAATYARYREGGGELDLEAWRRQNVNTLVREVGQQVRRDSPTALFGISPFGIWKPGIPETTEAQLNAYADLACDARLWLAEGWVDYLAPQLYWRIDPPAQSFPVLLRWWHEQSHAGRHVWAGIATQRINSQEDPGRPASEIVRQIGITRELARGTSAGHIHWNLAAIRRNEGGIRPLLADQVYRGNSLVPASPWLRERSPANPTLSLQRDAGSGDLVAEVTSPRRSTGRWILFQVKRGGEWRQLPLVRGESTRVAFRSDEEPAIEAIAVRAVSASGLVSEPVVTGVR